jgi:Sigma-70, region 4
MMLTKREYEALSAGIELKLTLREAAALMRVSRERVRQLQKSGLRRVILAYTNRSGEGDPKTKVCGEMLADEDGGTHGHSSIDRV